MKYSTYHCCSITDIIPEYFNHAARSADKSCIVSDYQLEAGSVDILNIKRRVL